MNVGRIRANANHLHDWRPSIVDLDWCYAIRERYDRMTGEFPTQTGIGPGLFPTVAC
jgi:hypothetical protein